MIYHAPYADVPDEAVEAFVRAQELGRLVTVDAEGAPDIGLYPFVYEGGRFEIHLNRSDAQIAHLEAHARCLFELDEVLATVPSHWIHPESAVLATAYYRTVVFDCEARVSKDAGVLAEQQTRLLARYQPEGGFRPVRAEDPLYQGALETIASVRLEVRGRRVKFKLGQNRAPADRARVVAALRSRGRPGDARAAEALQWTIDREEG